MDDTRASRIRDKLRRLRELDPLLVRGNARWHGYELGPRLSEAQLAAFEVAFGAALPEEYRWFLRELGDGGAGPGPFHGLRALTSQDTDLELAVPSRLWWRDPPAAPADDAADAAADDAATAVDDAATVAAVDDAAAMAPVAVATGATVDLAAETTATAAVLDDSWPDGEPLRAYLDRMRARSRCPRFDEEDAALLARLYAAYEAEPDVRDIDIEAFEAREPPAGDPGDDDPDDGDDRPDDATIDFLGAQWTLFFHRRQDTFFRGTLPLAQRPDGHQLLLVVSGGERGSIWSDSGITMSRQAAGFLDWYEAWLDAAYDDTAGWRLAPAETIADRGRQLIAEARARGDDPQPELLAFHTHYGVDARRWPDVLEVLEEHGTPSSPLAQCRADALLELGRYAEAERWYREADRALLEPEVHIGERMFRLRGFVTPVVCFLPSPRWGLARALVAQGQRDEALGELARLPPTPLRFIEAGLIAYDLRRFDEVVRLTSIARFLANLLGDRDNEVSALINRGNALLALERLDAARADYARAADRVGRDPRIHHNLACLEALAGDHAAAMAHVEQAVSSGVIPALFDDEDLIALRDDPAHHARFTALAARSWWRRA